MLAISLIVIGIILRLTPHLPNFTPVAAIAIFSGAYLNKKYALLVPLALMMFSDIFVGMHNVIIFTWGAFALTTLLGLWVKKHKSIFGFAIGSSAAAIIFYLITNFGVWVMGWYPQNLQGLINCYIMGLPFLRNFALSTIFYSVFFFAVYELIAGFVKNTKLSRVLLTI